MAIQGTQVPIYTNTHCFLYFSNFLFYFYEKKKKTKTKKQPNKNIKEHTKYKTRLTEKKKQNKQEMHNQKKRGKK